VEGDMMKDLVAPGSVKGEGVERIQRPLGHWDRNIRNIDAARLRRGAEETVARLTGSCRTSATSAAACIED
jgi:hypothetical protein